MTIVFRKLKAIVAATFLGLCATPTMSQDLLANQAPVDKALSVVDSVELNRLIMAEEEESPASELYDDWDNRYAHRETALPDSFLIDLRGFCMPTESRIITSNFGRRWGRQHKGIDVKVYIGDTIRAAFGGKVRIVRYERGGYGKFVVIRHPNGLETIYGHMSKQLVVEDQVVKAGEPIGLGGNTGRSTGSHLHFETRLCGVALNPAIMFDFRNQDVIGDSYMFYKGSYKQDSSIANRLRGVDGSYSGDDMELELSAPEANYAKDIKYHKVQAGETLASIAKKHGTSVEEICRLNHIGKKMRLMPGQILKYN